MELLPKVLRCPFVHIACGIREFHATLVFYRGLRLEDDNKVGDGGGDHGSDGGSGHCEVSKTEG